VGGLNGDRQGALLPATLTALAAAALVFHQGGADEVDEGGKGEFLGGAGAALRLEEVVAGQGIPVPWPKPENGLGPREAAPGLRCQVEGLPHRLAEGRSAAAVVQLRTHLQNSNKLWYPETFTAVLSGAVLRSKGPLILH